MMEDIQQRDNMFAEYPDVLTIKQLQSALQIGRSSAYRLINDERIRSIRIGRDIKIPKRFLVDFVLESGQDNCYNNRTAIG